MDWHFTETDHDSRHLKNASELTVATRADLSDMEIFVREVLQNSLDNRASHDPVRVDFRLKLLTGGPKHDFLRTIRFDELRRHIKAIREYDQNSTEFPNPAIVSESGYALRLLYIDDYGTRGLVGPEHSFEVARFPKPHCFVGLCRNIGDSQKTNASSGGIYGFGKTVLWKHSPWRLVFFNSQLATPYKSAQQMEYWTRFFGHVRLTGHHIGDVAYTGDGYWGNRKGQVTWSLMDLDAERCAREFAMAPRTKAEAGTSILIVDFQDPDAEQVPSAAETLSRIREAAEEYYWPALTEGRLQVRIRSEGEEEAEWQTREVLEIPHLAPFLKTYIAANSGSARPNIKQKQIPVIVPKGPNADQDKCKSFVLSAVAVEEEIPEIAAKYRNKTALIRGSGMVVGYKNFARLGYGKSDFFSIVLGGKSCPSEYSADIPAQERCEQFLAYSEPVTHDDWTTSSENLKKWYGSKAELRRMLDEVKKAISEAAAQAVEPEGRVVSLLSSFFPLAAGAENESARDMHVEFVMNPTSVACENGQVKVQFAIRVKVPAKLRFAGPVPFRWKVQCRYGFYGEDVRRKVVQNAEVGFTEYKKNGSGWILLGDFRPDFEAEMEDSDLSYEFRGETAPLESFLASITKQELQIKVMKSFAP
jgi:hypothetical protein